MSEVEKLREVAIIAFSVRHELKHLTKEVPATTWTAEYRALAEKISPAFRNRREREPVVWRAQARRSRFWLRVVWPGYAASCFGRWSTLHHGQLLG